MSHNIQTIIRKSNVNKYTWNQGYFKLNVKKMEKNIYHIQAVAYFG